MSDVPFWLVLFVAALNAVLTVAVLIRGSRSSGDAAQMLREELRTGRDEARIAAKELREEVSLGQRSATEVLAQTLLNLGKVQQTQLEAMTRQLKDLADSDQRALERIRVTFDSRVKELQEGNEKKLGEVRKDLSDGLKATNDALSKLLERMDKTQQAQLEGMTKQLKELTDFNQGALDRIRNTFDTRVKELQEGNERKLDEMRNELSGGLKATNDVLSKSLDGMGKAQQAQLEGVTKQLKDLADSNQGALDRIRNTFDARVRELQEGNEKKLDEMRKTVDEKLHETMEKRLGESFKMVSDRLEAVHKGLGEMQSLASGVGDLKRVLTNVKARGTWAEVQLGAILEQILTPGQYEKNVRVKPDSMEHVEYAIRLPGSKSDPAASVWLPIDSKFPQEDYLRVQQAADEADPIAVQKASDALLRTIRLAAKDVYDKYVSPPHTTDFGIVFLATEGLYAEVLRQPGLVETLLQEYRVVVAGPTTLAAILSSLRMGFQTLAIEQRAAEVWHVLGAVKTEFGKFGDVLDRVKRQLNSASRTIDETGVRARAMERKLRSVEQLPEEDANRILQLPAATGEPESEPAMDDAAGGEEGAGPDAAP